MNKKYQVFISSTYIDLAEPRNKVIEAILKLYHFPIGMEMFSAGNDEQWQIIEETIDSSNFYIILVGSRYGSLTKEGISFTEKEYDYAKQIGVPILTFIKDENVPTTSAERESDPETIEKLNKFRAKVSENKVREVWKNSDELAYQVTAALNKSFFREKRVGWVRGDSISEETGKELLQLTKDNRELRETVAKLEALTSNREPKLEIVINDDNLLDISIPDKDWNDVFTDIPNELPQKVPEHLSDFVELEDIERYNRNLPTEEKLYKYKQDVKLYFLSKFSLELVILIRNIGNCKANNVSIEIEFPDFVQVFEDSLLSKISFPKDVFLENPIVKAESKYEASLKNTFSGLGIADFTNASYITNTHPGLDIKNFSSLINQNPMYIVQGNSFTINLPNLLHTRSRNISNEVSIIPLEEGTGDIKISIICEEMEFPESIIIPITVKTNKNLDFKRDHYDPN